MTNIAATPGFTFFELALVVIIMAVGTLLKVRNFKRTFGFMAFGAFYVLMLALKRKTCQVVVKLVFAVFCPPLG